MDVDVREVSKITAETFGKMSGRYAFETKDFLQEHLMQEAQYFLNNIPGSRILDVGSGPGRDSAYFASQGFHPVCIDLSTEMVELCKRRSLEAKVLDFRELSKHFPPYSFDGVWAYLSLNLMPKSELPGVLMQIKQLLAPKGLLFIGVHEGDHDGWNERVGWKRYWKSKYRDEEISGMLSRFFNIELKTQVKGKSRFSEDINTYLNYLCRRTPQNSMTDKLVRDKIPDMIRDQGKIPVTHTADPAEYLVRLKEKLREEIAEFMESENPEELADILEVIHAIREYKNLDEAELERLRKKKAEERGGFSGRIVLDDIKAS